MFKINYEIGRINSSFKIIFNVIVSNKSLDPSTSIETVKKSMYNGNFYLAITSFPYIMINIQKKNEEWNNNLSVNFNKYDLYRFTKRLEEIYEKFKVKDLFYIDDSDRLIINKELSENNKIIFKTLNKTILLQHSVVESRDENSETITYYEGIIFAINSYSFYAQLTYEELGYFIHELKNIDMDTLTMLCLNYAKDEIESNNFSEYNSFLPRKTIVVERPQEELNDNKSFFRPSKQSVIPDI